MFVLVGGTITHLVTSWALMLMIGVLHNDYWSTIPPMGFATAALVVGIPFIFAAMLLFLNAIVFIILDILS